MSQIIIFLAGCFAGAVLSYVLRMLYPHDGVLIVDKSDPENITCRFRYYNIHNSIRKKELRIQVCNKNDISH